MSTDLRQVVEIVGQDRASAILQGVVDTLKALERQANRTGKALQRSLGGDMLKPLAAVRSEAKGFGNDLAEAADRAAKGLRGDVAAVVELRSTLRGAVVEQKAFSEAARAAQKAGAISAHSRTTAARNAASARATATANDIRVVRQRWRVREASGRAERREIEASGNAWAEAQRRRLSMMDSSAKIEARRQREAARVEATKARSETVATDRRIGDVARIWRAREHSEVAEARHVSAMRRERDATRRRAMTAGRHAVQHGHHALRSINHPALASAGFWVTAGAAFGVEAGKHLLEAARNIDTATTRFRMMPGVTPEDSAKVRAGALREGMRIGLDPAEVIRLQLQGIKDGLPRDIAASLPAIVNSAVQLMGGSVERDGDELAKAVREASTVGWVKDAPGARSLMNQVSGLSTFNGNSPEKMQQFLASGGIGRGKELGWSQQQTLAFGAALNGSGERTGLGSARLMAQIPEIRAGMRDRYVKATRSHENSEENRVTRAAPRLLGYGGIGAMQGAFASPEGVTDFLSRMSKLPEQTRAAIEKGYGLGPQFNAVSAEMGADNGARYHQALKREEQLSSQTEGNDDLSKNSKIWSGSINFMVGQLKASVSAIQSELGDVIKDDILTPFTGWWVSISEAMLNGGLKADLHQAIQNFISGLGFSNLTAALNALRGSVGTFDFAGFMRGVGKGLRTVIDDLRGLARAFSGAGGLSAETVGRLAAELFGLSIALHVTAPALTLLGGIASAILAIRAAVEGVAIAVRLTGLADGIKALVGVETLATATGLLSIAGGLTAIGAAVQALLSAGVLTPLHVPKDTSKEEWDQTLWGRKPDGTSARPAWVDRLFGTGDAKPDDGLVKGRHGGLMPAPKGFKPTAYQGGEDPDNWRNLLTRASYSPSDSGSVARDAMVDTARGVVEVRDAVDRLGEDLKRSALDGVGSGGVDNRGGLSGAPNMRYGRGSGGAYRGTPGGGGSGDGSGTPKVGGGSGGSRSWRNNNPGNIEYGPYAKSMGATGSDGRFAVFPSYDSGRKAQEHLLFESKGYKNLTLGQAIGKWAPGSENNVPAYIKAMGGDPNTRMSDFSPAQRGKLLDAMQAHEGWKVGTRKNDTPSGGGSTSSTGGGGGSAGKAVDIALGMQGAGERQAQQTLGAYMHPGEWCADFVNGALQKAGIKGTGSGMADSFSRWGHHVGFSDTQKGDVIEENDGRGTHIHHAGLATGNVQRDKGGNVTALEMVSGNYGHMVKKNWEKVGIIADLRRSDQAIEQVARKVGDSVSPAAVAKSVHGHTRPQAAPAQGDDTRAAAGQSADNSTIHHTWHVYGEPAKKVVQAHLLTADSRNSRTNDIDAFSS